MIIDIDYNKDLELLHRIHDQINAIPALSEELQTLTKKISSKLTLILNMLSPSSPSDKVILFNNRNELLSVQKSLAAGITSRDMEVVLYFDNLLDKITAQLLSPNAYKLETEIKNLEEKLHTVSKTADIRLENLRIAVEKGNLTLSQQGLGNAFYEYAKRTEIVSYVWVGLIIIIFVLIYLGSQSITISSYNAIDYTQERIYVYLLNIFCTLLPHIPSFVVAFWALWFCTKQFSHNTYIKDDYYYKAILSYSFYGYKTEAGELDNLSSKVKSISLGEDNRTQSASMIKEKIQTNTYDSEILFQKMLFEKTINTIGKNPAEAPHQDCNSPYAELLGKMNETLAKVCEMVKSVKNLLPSTTKKKE